MFHEIFFGLFFCAFGVAAADLPKASEIGAHDPIMLFKKNQNPQNVMVIYTKTEPGCRFALRDKKPILDFYWMMNGSKYKPVNGLIKNGIRDRIAVDAPKSSESKSFYVSLKDLSEMKNDLESPRLLVRAVKNGPNCDVEGLVTMGPSDKGAVVKLDDIYANAETTLLPPFRRVVSVTLDGVNAKTGQKFSRTFFKR